MTTKTRYQERALYYVRFWADRLARSQQDLEESIAKGCRDSFVQFDRDAVERAARKLEYWRKRVGE